MVETAMPHSLADLICEYWRGPDALTGHEFSYLIPPPVPALAPHRSPYYTAMIAPGANSGGAGTAMVVVEHHPHGVTFPISEEVGSIDEGMRRQFAERIEIGMTRELVRLLRTSEPPSVEFIVRPDDLPPWRLPREPGENVEVLGDHWNPWGSVFSREPLMTAELQMMYGCASVERLADEVLREGATTTAKPAPLKPWAPIPGLKTIFHPGGQFWAPDGKRRFDYVFPELIDRPDIPRDLLPNIATLRDGSTLFQGRAGRERHPINQWEHYD